MILYELGDWLKMIANQFKRNNCNQFERKPFELLKKPTSKVNYLFPPLRKSLSKLIIFFDHAFPKWQYLQCSTCSFEAAEAFCCTRMLADGLNCDSREFHSSDVESCLRVKFTTLSKTSKFEEK